MDYLPLFVRLRGRTVLVVGGGRVAARKCELLLRAGASLRLVAPELHEELKRTIEAAGGEWRAACFDASQLDGCVAAVAATGVAAVDEAVREAAHARGTAVNVVDRPELCDFIFPAIVDRDPLLIAVSSGGNAPILARRIRARIETLFPAAWGRLASFLGERRALVRARIADAGARLRVWERVVDGAVGQHVLAGREDAAAELFERALQGGDRAPQGEVYLVGTGPGDPELLSIRALRLMQNCDVVLHDRLVSTPIMELVRRDAERIYVGKRSGEHLVEQPDINALMVEHARAGRRVLRLKGGDPFIFGRGGEEIEHLAEAGIPFQVVPGITAASGCAACAGIPLTHRDHAQSVRFVTGHLRDGRLDLDWASLVRQDETLVFYMGLTGLPTICEELVRHGMAAETPVALVERGTLPEQRVLVSTLVDMPALLARSEVRAPTLTIVGSVVSLRDRLEWNSRSQTAPSPD